ncbi:Heterokaryon incompatibility protein (HET) domain containing protein [Naviculisporaceae sp. PSN 640]
MPRRLFSPPWAKTFSSQAGADPRGEVLYRTYTPLESAISFDPAICQSCKDYIPWLTSPASHEDVVEEWEDFPSCLDGKLPSGTISSLRVSAKDCRLCELILRQIDIGPDTTDLRYQIGVGSDPEPGRDFLVQCNGRRFEFHILEGPEDISTMADYHEKARVLFSHDREGQRLEKVDVDYASSPEGFMVKLAKHWMRICAEEHLKCNQTRPKAPLPKRVLDISTSDKVYLYEPSPQTVVAYAALSYCWGKGLPLNTTKQNISRHREGIRLSLLPATLKESVLLARSLGFQYLWIDSLCIIQDDEQDWATQAAQMTYIYQGCSLNIAIADSPNCDSGIVPALEDVTVRVGTIGRTGLKHSTRHDLRIVAPGHAHGGDPLDLGVLSSRGWTFQETLVSTSTLLVTRKGLSWSCCSGMCHQTDWALRQHNTTLKSLWSDSITRGYDPSATPRPDQLTDNTMGRTEDKVPHWELWHRWVPWYSDRALTKLSDKLPAVAGLATHLAGSLGWTYAAGLWEEHIHFGLTWSAVRPEKLTRNSTSAARAPSWSWASVNGGIQYAALSLCMSHETCPVKLGDEDLQILTLVVEEDIPGTFGSVNSGRMEAMATMYLVPSVTASNIGKFRIVMGDIGFQCEDTNSHRYACFDESIELSSRCHDGKISRHCSPYSLARLCAFRPTPEPTYIYYLILKAVDATTADTAAVFARVGLAVMLSGDHGLDAWNKGRRRITIV